MGKQVKTFVKKFLDKLSIAIKQLLPLYFLEPVLFCECNKLWKLQSRCRECFQEFSIKDNNVKSKCGPLAHNKISMHENFIAKM